MLDPEVRKSFYDVFSKEIMQAVDFKIIACFVFKKEMIKKYGKY
jgi:hypothetical protein